MFQEIINLNDSKVQLKNYLDDFPSEELTCAGWGAGWGVGGCIENPVPIESNPGTVSDLVTCIRLYVTRAGREGDGKPAP